MYIRVSCTVVVYVSRRYIRRVIEFTSSKGQSGDRPGPSSRSSGRCTDALAPLDQIPGVSQVVYDAISGETLARQLVIS